MVLPREYMEDLLVRLSYHSNAIENNRITLPETVSIILHHTVPNRVSLQELYEIDNHRYAMEYLLSSHILQRGFSFNEMFETHSILLHRLHHEKGKFKTETNFIKGADFETTHPSNVFMEMKQWIDNLHYRVKLAVSEKEIITAVCDSHIAFERIHPFADGNGRIGRLIMNYFLVKNDIPPLVIEKDDKERYFHILANENIEGFSRYACEKIQKEQRRMKSFVN